MPHRRQAAAPAASSSHHCRRQRPEPASRAARHEPQRRQRRIRTGRARPVRLVREYRLPGRRERRLSAPAQDVDAAGQANHLRKPMPCTKRRLQPFGEEHPPPGQPAHGRRNRLCRPPHASRDLLRAVGHAEPGTEEPNRVGHLAERSWIERDHLRPDRTRRRQLPARHRTHRAQILGHDQVRRELGDQIGIDRIQGATLAKRGAHRLVDLEARQLRRIDPRRRDHRQADDLNRPPTLFRYSYQRGEQAQLRDDLCRARKKGTDPHRPDDTPGPLPLMHTRAKRPGLRVPAGRAFSRTRRGRWAELRTSCID